MIYTLGESLMDIIFTDSNQITAKAGGGMLNTAISLSRSGVQVSLISELGDDRTASFIIDFLKKNKVNIQNIKKYYHQKTSVAIAHLNEFKVPSFSIYKSYPKNRRLIQPKNFNTGDILLFGSLYSLDPVIRNEVVEIIVKAKKEGALIIYDPNIRSHNLDRPELRAALNQNFSFADIIKGSEEDFMNIFGKGTADNYFKEVQKLNQDAYFIFTMGENGVTGYKGEEKIDLPAKEIEVVSTIGAGDAFNAGMAYFLVKNEDDKNIVDNKSSAPLLEGLLRSGLNFSAKVCSTLDNYVPNKLV